MSGSYYAGVGARAIWRGDALTWQRRLQELWNSRRLMLNLVQRDLKAKYQRSVFGFAWTLLNPLMTVAVLVAVFSVVLRIQLEHYWAFLLSGYFAWNTANHVIFSGSFVLPEHAKMTRSVAFPHEILILSATLSRLVEFAVEILIISAVLAVTHHHGFPLSMLLLPVLVVVLFLLSAGLAFPVAVASTLFSDIRHALPIVMTSLFYLSPVFYPVTMIPDAVRPFYFLNPFASLLTLFHRVLYEGQMPSPVLLFGTLFASLGIFVVGYAVFHRYQQDCAELV